VGFKQKIKKNIMKKITLLLAFILMGLSSINAQLFDVIRTNGGAVNTQSRTVTDWLHYDNDANANAFGASSGSHTLGVYIKLTSTVLASHINRQIEEMRFYLGAQATNITGNVSIEIYTSPSAPPVYTEDFPMSTLTADDWNTVSLATPYAITGAELYVGYKFTAPGYVIGVDDGAAFVAGVNYYTYDGPSFTAWDGVSQTNFNLQAGVGGATAANDAGVSDVDMPNIVVVGNHDILATITNYGSTVLNSIDFNYKVDNGTTQTQSLTGLNLTNGQSANFTHNVAWDAIAGLHSLDVWVSNFNSIGADDIPANDHLIKAVSVASQTTQNMPLYEEFTSSTCGPCASFNADSFNMTFLNVNTGHYNLIKYQMSWPGSGDIYYTAEGGVRRTYYGVSGVPTLYLEGSVGPDFFQHPNQLQPKLDEAYAAPAYFDMTASYAIDATSHDITVDVNWDAYLSGNYTLHCAVVEKTTTGNVGNNGETSFHNVMMKMLPNASGTSITTTADVFGSVQLSGALANTFVEDWNDLEVVVFMQDDTNKTVMQSTKAVLQTSDVQDVTFAKVRIYPNPSNGQISIDNAAGMQIQIVDVLGNVVYTNNNLSVSNSLVLNNLSNGVYFVRLHKGNKTGLRKIVIAK